jgi:hypothetical protein
VITVPEAANSTVSPPAAAAPIRSEAVWPRASAICEATVRIQISS